MPRLVRSAALNGYVEVARSAGLDPYRMIAACGLPPACLTDPEIKVSIISVAGLLEESSRQSGVPDFGLRLAERRSLSNLGAVALIVREQPTIRKVFEALVDYIHLHSEALLLRVEDHDDLVILTLSIDIGRPVPMRQGVEMGIGFLHRSLQRLLGTCWKPCGICFVHEPPVRKDTHRRFFGTRVEFEQDYNGIICYGRDLEAAVTTSDSTMVRHI
jgi:hypothetical protein